MRIRACLFGLLVGLLVPTPTWGQAPSDSTYTVQSGDTLYRIAQTAGVSVDALMRWNDLDDPGGLQVGQSLRIRPPTPAPDTSNDAPLPSTPSPPARDTTTPPPPAPTTSDSSATYTVKSGDTFVGLALRLGTTADTLFALNDHETDTLTTGRPLRVPPRFGPPTHVVDSSETLYSIAGRYGASVRALRTLNDLDTTTLSPGQRLRLPEPPDRWPPGTYSDPDTTGTVAVYPEAFAGRLMASGSTYAPDDYVVSHPSLPFGSVVLLSRPGTQTHTFARVLDRGSVEEKLLLDLSATVAQRLDISPDATPTVALRVVWRADE